MEWLSTSPYSFLEEEHRRPRYRPNSNRYYEERNPGGFSAQDGQQMALSRPHCAGIVKRSRSASREMAVFERPVSLVDEISTYRAELLARSGWRGAGVTGSGSGQRAIRCRLAVSRGPYSRPTVGPRVSCQRHAQGTTDRYLYIFILSFNM